MPDVIFTLPIGTYEAAQSCPLGTEAWDKYGARYRYVQFLDAVTYVKGHVTSLASATTYKVTNDVSGGSSVVLRFTGVLPYYKSDGTTTADVPAQNAFGWLMVEGFHPFIKTNGDDDIAAGDELIMVATDGVVDSVTSGTTTGSQLYVGTASAVDVDADNTVPGFVCSPIW